MNQEDIFKVISEWIHDQEKHKGNHLEIEYRVVLEGKIITRDGQVQKGKDTRLDVDSNETRIETTIRLA